MTTTSNLHPVPVPARRRPPVAHLLAAVIGLYGLLNVVRALADPVAFADDFGIPLNDPSETTFVTVYASRTAALALGVLALIALRQRRAVAVLVTAVVLIPIADAVQTAVAGAETTTVLRHSVIAVALTVVALLCWREDRVATGGR